MKMAGRVAVWMDFRDGRGLKKDNGGEQQEEQRGLVKTRSPSRLSGDTYHPMEYRRGLAVRGYLSFRGDGRYRLGSFGIFSYRISESGAMKAAGGMGTAVD